MTVVSPAVLRIVFIVLATLCLLTVGRLHQARAEDNPFAGRTVLVMVDDRACSWCRKWEREVGVGYGKSAEGKRAPLVKILRNDKRLTKYKGLAYTPTFLLLVNGEERARLVGYPGADFFWAELARMLQKAPPVPEERAQIQSASPTVQ